MLRCIAIACYLTCVRNVTKCKDASKNDEKREGEKKNGHHGVLSCSFRDDKPIYAKIRKSRRKKPDVVSNAQAEWLRKARNTSICSLFLHLSETCSPMMDISSPTLAFRGEKRGKDEHAEERTKPGEQGCSDDGGVFRVRVATRNMA